jgi:glycoside/pentoside/hexuronide:cation symporter, GPH family
MEEKIPIRIRLLFASGMAGWSILTNLILVLGPYFYLPPQKSGLSPLIPQIAWFGVVNLMSLIFSAGRITDAFLDPLIARWSDNNRSRFGRRIPFLRGFFIPASFFAVLVFFPPVGQVSEINAWWLTLVLILFYVSATAYVIPMNALIPEIARTTPGKISISLYQQAGFVVGVIISALSNNIAAGLEASGLAADYNSSLKFSAVLLGFAGAFLMGLPAFLLKEPLREKTEHVTPGLFRSLKETLAIRNFRFYLLADFSFYTSLSLISSGLLYYVTVLAGLEKEKGGVLMGVMVISSLIFYPVISKFGKRLGYKFWIISGLFILSGVFCLIFFLGTLPFSGAAGSLSAGRIGCYSNGIAC